MPADLLTPDGLATHVTALSGLAVTTPIAIAVSGGADSLALMRLAASALPAAHILTMDHGLRPEAAAEAATVVRRAESIGLPATILRPESVLAPANVQAGARDARYAAMLGWCRANAVPILLTAHHADDQAETLLMRLARGSGLAGLSGIREKQNLDGVLLLRPLLGWPRASLHAALEGSGWTAVVDPSNTDPRFDRTRARALLAETAWLDASRLATSASNLAQAEAALIWAASRAWDSRTELGSDQVIVDPEGLPAEIVRRLLLLAFACCRAPEPDGPTMAGLMDRLQRGQTATASGLAADTLADGRWRLRPAAPHRSIEPSRLG